MNIHGRNSRISILFILIGVFLISNLKAQKKDSLKEDLLMEYVDIQAKYNGDWKAYLTKELEKSLKKIKNEGTILVRFIVDEQGKVVVTNCYGDEKLCKIGSAIINKSGRWIPAERGGKPIKAYRTQPITFSKE